MPRIIEEHQRSAERMPQPQVSLVILRPVGVSEPQTVERFILHVDSPREPRQRSGRKQKQRRSPLPCRKTPAADLCEPPCHNHDDENKCRHAEKAGKRQKREQQPRRQSRTRNRRSFLLRLALNNESREKRKQNQRSNCRGGNQIGVERFEKRRFQSDHIEIKKNK